MVLGNLIGGFIVVLIGANLIPTIADSVVAAQTSADGVNATNVTGAASMAEPVWVSQSFSPSSAR